MALFVSFAVNDCNFFYVTLYIAYLLCACIIYVDLYLCISPTSKAGYIDTGTTRRRR